MSASRSSKVNLSITECTFCEVVKADAGALKAYENEQILAFWPKVPVVNGHTLVITKEHYCDIFEIPTDLLQETIAVCEIIANRLRNELGVTAVNLIHASGEDAQQSVFHFHIHVVPRYPDDGLDFWLSKSP